MRSSVPAPPAGGNAGPRVSRPDPAAVPPELARLPRWLPRVGKVPVSRRTGLPVRHDAAANLSPLTAALVAADRLGATGVGFSVPPGGGVVAVDLDNCRDPRTHAVTPAAAAILGTLADTYAEVSSSGTGLRLFAAGDLDPLGHRRGDLPGLACGGGPGSLEVYDGRQFVTVTGDRLPGRPAAIADHAAALWGLQRLLGPKKSSVKPQAAGAGFAGADAALLARAFAADNGTAVRRLWHGEYDRAKYPTPSQVLIALANHLAFWTGPDPARLFALMTGSPLVTATEGEREKWWSHRPGGPWGLACAAAGAVADCHAFYSARPRQHPATAGEQPRPQPPAPSEDEGQEQAPTRRSNLLSSLIAPTDDTALGVPTLAAAVAWADAGNAAPGFGAGHRLAAVCYRLSVTSPGGVFFLSSRKAGEVLGVSHVAAAERLKLLTLGGRPLEVVMKGGRGAGKPAARYRWTGRA